jgi:hypothetical protein
VIVVDLREEARACAPNASDPGLLREAAIETWRGRMVNEYGSSRVFTALAQQMERAGFFTPKQIAECAKFAGEERKHGVLCGAVVESLGGVAAFELEDAPPLPEHEDTTPIVAVLRNAMSVGCMSETVAVSLIGAERIEMPEGEIRALLTLIWADEIGHARFGWHLLARTLRDLSAREREDLWRYVPVALAHLDRHELAHLPDCDAPKGGEAWGLCSGRSARQLYRATVNQIIVPRLRAMGYTEPKRISPAA